MAMLAATTALPMWRRFMTARLRSRPCILLPKGAAGTSGCAPLRGSTAEPRNSLGSQRPGASLDHLVGAGEESGWELEPDLPRGAEVEDEIELRRLPDWVLGRARSAKE